MRVEVRTGEGLLKRSDSLFQIVQRTDVLRFDSRRAYRRYIYLSSGNNIHDYLFVDLVELATLGLAVGLHEHDDLGHSVKLLVL
jgi:hypothetical protein